MDREANIVSSIPAVSTKERPNVCCSNIDLIQAIGWNSLERTVSDWKKLFSSVDDRLEFLGTHTPAGSSVSLIEAKFHSGVNGHTNGGSSI
jgi:hypothetical protein